MVVKDIKFIIIFLQSIDQKYEFPLASRTLVVYYDQRGGLEVPELGFLLIDFLFIVTVNSDRMGSEASEIRRRAALTFF